MILSGANDLIQLVTDATADIEVSVSWAQNNAGTITASGAPLASITTATTTTIVAAAGASQQRSVREISIFNNHGSTACTCTVQRTDGTNTVDLKQNVLAAGESMLYNESGTWLYYDPTGKPYMGLGPIATQAEMEAGTSLTTMVTPGRQHFHPSAGKCWGKTTVAGGTPTLQTSYNVTSITDTATDQLTVTIATDFSSTHYSTNVSIEVASTTLSATTLSCIVFIRNATLTATSFIIQACEIDVGGATDPSSWHWACLGDHA